MSYGNYPDLSKVKKILVVKLRHHGDVLLSSPVFSNLQQAIPGASIDAFIYRETFPMLEGHPGISDFLLYERGLKKLSFFKKLKAEFALLREIRRRRYDLVVNLTEGDRGAIAAMVSGAKIRVGFDPEGSGFSGKRRIFTHVVKHCKTPRHTVEKNLDALRKIGIFPQPEERGLTLEIPEKDLKRMEEKLPEAFWVVHPVSRWKFKCWPVKAVAQLIEKLVFQGERVVITASPDAAEIAMVEEILKLIPHAPVINLAGQISLKELAAVIQLSCGLICVDSVPLHMASALKTPVVALFGPTSDLNWGPWMHPYSRVVAQKIPCRPCLMDGCGGSKVSDCLQTLSVERVLEAVESLKVVAQARS